MSGPPKEPTPLAEALTREARLERYETLYGPDTDDGRELGRAIGENLKRWRTERSIDIPTLAGMADIETELLELLEAGDMVPSLRAIWRLATALGVPFGTLLLHTDDIDLTKAEFRVQRASEGRVVASSDNSFRSRLLFREGDARSPEVYELTLAPGCVEPADAHAPGTFEHITVVSGTLVVEAGDNRSLLGPGDAIGFQADIAHSYENPSDAPVVAHLVMHHARPSPT